jgi:hypothetical protein
MRAKVDGVEVARRLSHDNRRLVSELVELRKMVADYWMIRKENDGLRKRSEWLEQRVVELETGGYHHG